MKVPLPETSLEPTTVNHQRTHKRKARFFTRLAAGFGLASAILVVIGVVSYRSFTEEEQGKLRELRELREVGEKELIASSAMGSNLLSLFMEKKGKFLPRHVVQGTRHHCFKPSTYEMGLLSQLPQLSSLSSGIFLTFFILAGVYYFIYREITERKRTEAALHQERDFTSAVLDTAGALVVVLDPQGRIVRFNRACEQTTGYSFDEVKGKCVWDLFLMAEKVEAFQVDFEKLLFREASANKIGETCQVANQHENYWIMRDGDRRLIAWSNTLMSDKVGAVDYVIATGIDITERKQVEEQVNLLQALMLAIGETQDFDEALAVILRTVCETKGWNYGEVWTPYPKESLLRCSSAWYSRADGSGRTFAVLEKFRRLSEELTFGLGIGLPGRVWSSKLPEWQEDVSRELQINFLRAQIARECGLRAGLGIPLIVNEQVLAVLVFFKLESSKEDLRLVESISAVATQLGSVIQRKRMEEVLRESEERFKAFMNNSPAVAFMKDEEGRFIYVNEQCERCFNIKVTDWLGKTDFDLWPDEIAKQLRENDRRVLSADKTLEILETVPTPDGGVRHWLSFKFPCLDVSGRRLLGGVAIDVTERSSAEAALRETTTLQRAILDSANYAIISTTFDGTICTFNAAAERLLGYASEEVVGKTTPVIFHDSDELVQRAQDLYAELGVPITFGQYLITPGFEVMVAKARRGEPDEREWSYIRKDGSRFPVLLSVTALRDAEDNITGFLGIGSDITERKRAESALLESKTRLSLINSISTEITSGMSVAQVIESTVKQISRYFNTLRVAYSTIDDQGILCVLHSIEPPGMAQLTGKVADLTAAPEYLNALHLSEPVIAEDVATDSRLAPLADAMKAGDTQAILDVPLQHSEQLVGLLCFDSPQQRKWNEHEIVTLREVADYLTVAIKEANAQLERHRAESELREMSVALQNAVEGISRLDTHGRYISVNRAYASMVGYKPEEMIGMEWQTTLHPEDCENMVTAYQHMLINGKVEAEARGLRKDGSVFYKQLMMVSAYDKGQKFIGHYHFIKDITERKRTDAALQQANEKLTGWVNELEQRNREIALLGEISDVLQACLTVEEAYTAIAKLVQPLFPETSGGIFLMTASKNLVEAFATWGSPPFASQKLFTPDECWALRRGRAHWVDDLHGGLVCKHIHQDSLPTESLCVPMMAQGEALGVLYLSSLEMGRLTQTKQHLAVTVAEHIALSLANLKLRETLKNQSVRDPLTGLFNRRYLEESLEREVNRAQRKQQSLGIIMLDVDHFKRFNDTFGHEAGDAVLRELGQFLQKYVRKSDIACRYGGEELTLILPEASLEITHQRAEQLREGIKHLQVQHRHQQLGTITLSLGVACFPEHGITGEAVMQAADAALYRAKNEGRDAVRLAS